MILLPLLFSIDPLLLIIDLSDVFVFFFIKTSPNLFDDDKSKGKDKFSPSRMSQVFHGSKQMDILLPDLPQHSRLMFSSTSAVTQGLVSSNHINSIHVT